MGFALFNQNCVVALHIGKNQKLLYRRLIPHITFLTWMRIPPLLGSLTEQSDIQQVSLICVGKSDLVRGQCWGNQILLDGISVNAIIELRYFTVQIPA